MVILFDQFNMSDDVFEVIFATEQQIEVGKLLITAMKAHGGEFTKQDMSEFATKLHDGVMVKKQMKIGFKTHERETKMSYNKRQFYDRILTPMKSMGLIDYDLYKKTYKLSSQFTKTLQKVAHMWSAEARK